MMLTNKMTPAEQSSEAFFSTPDTQNSSGNTGFLGLFSSMVAEQSGGGEEIKSLPLAEAQAMQSISNEVLDLPKTPSSVLGTTEDVTAQFASLSSLSSMLETKPDSETVMLQPLSTEGGENLTALDALNGVLTTIEAPLKEVLREPLNDAVFAPVLDEGTNANLILDQSITAPQQMLDLTSLSAKTDALNQNESVDPFLVQPINHQNINGQTINGLQAQEMVASSVQTGSTVSNGVLNQGASSPNLGLATSQQGTTQSSVSWGTQSADAQTSQGFGQQGQSSGQPSQNGSGQSAQQQAMMFAQMSQGKQQSLEQQAAVRAMDDAVSKTEGRELLGGAEIASLDRKSALPLGLQTINLPVKHPQWGQALGQRIVFMSNNGMQQAQITLNPQKLGQIQVMLQLDKDQQMHVSLVAQNGATRESMESALPRLKEMMEQAGIQLASVNVSDQKQFSESGDAQEHHRKNASKNTLVEGNKVEERPLLMTGSTDNIIDYYA